LKNTDDLPGVTPGSTAGETPAATYLGVLRMTSFEKAQ